MAWRHRSTTFVPIEALNGPVLDGDPRLVKGCRVRKNSRVSRIADTTVSHGRKHINAVGPTRTGEHGLTLVSWTALDSFFVAILALAIALVGDVVGLTS